MSDKKDLKGLQDLLIKELLKRIEDGSASSTDLNVARQLLKDNQVIVDIRDEESPIFDLNERLPFRAVE